ncbi:MAG: DUF305 domain-containing protein [Halalkalicoccus sp.]
MTRSNRRRFLYALGAASTVGFVGYSAADEHGDEDRNGDHEHHDDGHHDEHAHEGDDDPDGEFNEADVEFMRMMILHHEQAIEMAKLIPGRTDRRELCDLGPEIIEVQQAEIEQMHDWLAEADADPDHGDHGHDHGDHGEMDGMLSEAEMVELRCAEGEEFDCLFVEGMIVHHEGAIDMSEEVLAEGSAERVAALAAEVIEVQREEIEMMEG